MLIKDGTGNGFTARVDRHSRLETHSTTTSEESWYLDEGQVWNYNTGTINLTSDTSSAIAYIKNNGDSTMIVTGFIFLLGVSTGGVGDIFTDIIRNPTNGTLVSNAVENIPSNRNFGSTNTIDGLFYNGVEGDTIIGDEVSIESILQAPGRIPVSVSVALPKGASLGARITPPAGNTSMNIQLAMPMYLET